MEWKPCGSATLVGSMPHKDREKVINFILENLKEIPLWPQLPFYPEERMMNQYLEGLPGYTKEWMESLSVDTSSADFERDLYEFYSDYMAISEEPEKIALSRFAMGEKTGKTFMSFLRALHDRKVTALKGQVVGPFTLLSGMKDKSGRLLIFDDRMVDVVSKHLAMKALWQANQLKYFTDKVIIFFDEPALAGFGSSAFIGVSQELVKSLISEILSVLKPQNVMVGIHVCANTDWSLLLNSGVGIINYDAYNYSDKFMLYKTDIISFLERGGIIAWGIVPTGEDKVKMETPENLFLKLENLIRHHLREIAIEDVYKQSIITPSCGCGTLSEEVAEKIVKYTVECASLIKSRI